jgi:uncharacterized membrane protein
VVAKQGRRRQAKGRRQEDGGIGSRRSQRLFRLAMLVKGIDGAVELLGALTVLAVPGVVVHRLVTEVLARDLLGPADGSLAHRLTAAADTFTSGGRTFAAVYLSLHGVIKLVLVVALLRHVRTAYPVAVVILAGFVGYELIRAVRTGSLLLPVLAAIDVAVIVLVVREYRMLRAVETVGPPR